jgi:hypothetical protein
VDRKTTPKFHVHHVWSFQLRETRANPVLMVLLCRPCHLFVHSNANTTREFLPQDLSVSVSPVDLESEMARAMPAGLVLERLQKEWGVMRQVSMSILFEFEQKAAGP